MQNNELLNIAILAAKEAGNAILSYYDSYDLTYKTDSSPLTSADLAANDIIFKHLEKTGILICSEEKILDYKYRDENSKFWLVDPLDGTKEFIRKNGQFCVCIALIEFSKPTLGVIYAPALDEIFYSDGGGKVYKNNSIIKTSLDGVNNIISGNFSHSEKINLFADKFDLKILRQGSAIKFCRLVEGMAGVYVRFCGSKIWDNAAGDFLLTQSGGISVSIDTKRQLSYSKMQLANDNFLSLNYFNIQNLDKFLKFIDNFIL